MTAFKRTYAQITLSHNPIHAIFFMIHVNDCMFMSSCNLCYYVHTGVKVIIIQHYLCTCRTVCYFNIVHSYISILY